MNSEVYRHILQKYWHYDDFRSIQLEIIQSIGNGKDTLGLMPTGGGKSITFQVPAIASEGLCIVITPLIALMKDQVENLRHRGIKAAAIHTGMSHDKILATLENCIFGAYKLLYVSPERLTSETFIKKISHANVSFITVDEAHCITQWGYDFRPSYLKISDFRRYFPNAPILALTATATLPVVKDIQKQLGFKEDNVFRMSFLRPNLAYTVRKANDRDEFIRQTILKTDGSVIIYSQTRGGAEEMTKYLKEKGISCTFYHAGLDNNERNKRQEEWKSGSVQAIVATNAFGMGIDKPDVRMVIHRECPASIEAYFQEAGRAGRDGGKAVSILLYDESDHKRLLSQLRTDFPDKDYIRKVYDDLAYFFQVAVGDGYNCRHEFNIDSFCLNFRHLPVRALAAIRLLDQAGYIEFTDDDDNKSRVKFLLERDELYRLRNNSPLEDKLIETLLRSYGGLFVDYMFIDETFLAELLGIDSTHLYFTLKQLNDKNILHYIPRKKIPHIRYTQRREEGKRIVIPRNIYEDRYEKAAERIEAIVNYAEDDEKCRSIQLLTYFGEKAKTKCGLCDVCDNKEGKLDDDKRKYIYNKVMQLLSDKRPHPVDELLELFHDTTILAEVMTEMSHEELIGNDGNDIFLI